LSLDVYCHFLLQGAVFPYCRIGIRVL
jgi:hypothetical protein